MATGAHDLAFEAESSMLKSFCATVVEKRFIIDFNDLILRLHSFVQFHCALPDENVQFQCKLKHVHVVHNYSLECIVFNQTNLSILNNLYTFRKTYI